MILYRVIPKHHHFNYYNGILQEYNIINTYLLLSGNNNIIVPIIWIGYIVICNILSKRYVTNCRLSYINVFNNPKHFYKIYFMFSV